MYLWLENDFETVVRTVSIRLKGTKVLFGTEAGSVGTVSPKRATSRQAVPTDPHEVLGQQVPAGHVAVVCWVSTRTGELVAKAIEPTRVQRNVSVWVKTCTLAERILHSFAAMEKERGEDGLTELDLS